MEVPCKLWGVVLPLQAGSGGLLGASPPGLLSLADKPSHPHWRPFVLSEGTHRARKAVLLLGAGREVEADGNRDVGLSLVSRPPPSLQCVRGDSICWASQHWSRG